MQVLALLQSRFRSALESCDCLSAVDDLANYAALIRPAGNPKFGDYQANCAMPLAKLVSGFNPRELAQQIVDHLRIDDLCDPPTIAGPGFINLRLADKFLNDHMVRMLDDPRCLVERAASPQKIIIDYSSPNVAKPMHVGHIRSTVIGDSLARVLRFLGHEVITDNHLGDWGTQFGIIIYGYKHFGDPETVSQNPVPELAKLYRIVHQLMGYQKSVAGLPKLKAEIEKLKAERAAAVAEAEQAEGKDAKKKRKLADAAGKKLSAAEAALRAAQESIAAVESDPVVGQQASAHPNINQAVLDETSKLHRGDAENLQLWNEFLPFCKDEIERVYDRLHVSFDHTYGESYYHPMLADVVEDLQANGLATESDGAICVFLDDFDAPMIIRKSDGAYLYATTDLATLRFRLKTFDPDEILYVVDTRQGEHFEKLFAVARLTGLDQVKLVHVNFGTVLGEDGRPMKTRSGSLIGLESLLDDAVDAAYQVVCDPDRLVKLEPPMDEAEQKSVAEAVGIGAIKYADLGHDRASDYRFNLAKMVALSGNTATYAQYSFARTVSILNRVGVDESDVSQRVQTDGINLNHPAERALALKLLQFDDALHSVYADYGPNHLVEYVYATAEAFSKFNDQCHVMNAESAEVQTTRLALVVLTGRVIRQALQLLGIDVVQRM
ncbi:arginine--tRNA ligase [Roseiconus nitratireducens]|uniref:Arginine--tRNA ligase n=1 Tax=Roseiconus nitratireducens TaxID=2605748 RepID=A0A5M6DEB3_9BACT|nr:arginine--tRNA ligase [Roseiconus nitratireducens]KAA5545858.1 arginine--tRNA ligase [Roseiconus nitratireducens]